MLRWTQSVTLQDLDLSKLYYVEIYEQIQDLFQAELILMEDGQNVAHLSTIIVSSKSPHHEDKYIEDVKLLELANKISNIEDAHAGRIFKLENTVAEMSKLIALKKDTTQFKNIDSKMLESMEETGVEADEYAENIEESFLVGSIEKGAKNRQKRKKKEVFTPSTQENKFIEERALSSLL